MPEDVHSFGPTCIYYDEEGEEERPYSGETIPKAKAQFFYVSSLPIDDPLSPLPPISAEQSGRQPAKPFSAKDNAALEEAWQTLLSKEAETRDAGKEINNSERYGAFCFPQFQKLAQRSQAAEESEDIVQSETQPQPLLSTSLRPTHRIKRLFSGTSDDVDGLSSTPASQSGRVAQKVGIGTPYGASNRSRAGSNVMLAQDRFPNSPKLNPIAGGEMKSFDSNSRRSSTQPDLKRKRQMSLIQQGDKSPTRNHSLSKSPEPDRLISMLGTSQSSQNVMLSAPDISGRPFARAPSRSDLRETGDNTPDRTDTPPLEQPQPDGQNEGQASDIQAEKKDVSRSFVPVGVSRLHLVEMPDLMMKPIYWSPINDTSNVVRSTWFYKDTMAPLPAEVSNRLEIGYESMKPYTPAYQEELSACIENGAAAELKVVHKLWTNVVVESRPATSSDPKITNETLQEDDLTSALPAALENAAVDNRKPSKKRLFDTYSVIYVDAVNAQILKPSLLPSERQNRRPLNAIRKGRQIGIAVVRGFDRTAWLKLNPNPKLQAKIQEAKVGAYMSRSGDAMSGQSRKHCPVCDYNDKQPKATDLVLVIHGIGQKLSERMDSFHFTHAINGLRREFNVELSAESVQNTMKNAGGIMVLPVNWRLTLSFEDDPKSTQMAAENKYNLQDLTPDTLPAVRSLISDVMLDIPYYMSHHKHKMIEAVVREANRIYQLWCRNNPGFEDYGRVHLIAHSLGSVMAMEILSQQPTHLSKKVSLTSNDVNKKYFEFDTTNLFCCGSPSGFFLLLNGANLIPRKGRNKPGMEGEDHGSGIAGEAGTYGCLAVDNIYNICHRNDPVAYLQNACVDSSYSLSLEPANIPSAALGVFQRLGNTLRWSSPSTSNPYTTKTGPTRPQVQHMPSTVELETHNFSREEIAERRMFLLNDNGQIDFYLSSGGGPLEIQYLNMLGAHSSYWLLQDFVRFLVVEIGRQPGRQHTIPALRAVKKREYKRGNIA